MALQIQEQLDNLFSTTWHLMAPKVADNVFKATPFWYWLNSEGRVSPEDGGRWIGIQLMYGKNKSIKSIGRGGIVDVDTYEFLTTARFDWKTIAGSIVRLYDDDTNNQGKSQIINYVQSLIDNTELSLIDELETQSLGDGTGNNGLDIDGLQAMIKSSFSGDSYGGIDGSTYTWWQNKAYDMSGDALADLTDKMLYMYNLCSVGNNHPTLLLTSQAIYEEYEKTLTPLLRVTQNKLADAGFQALEYKGAAITFSPSLTDRSIYFLNGRYIELRYNKNAWFELTDWKPIPNQLDRVANVVLKCNLVTSNRRMHGLLHSIPAS